MAINNTVNPTLKPLSSNAFGTPTALNNFSSSIKPTVNPSIPAGVASNLTSGPAVRGIPQNYNNGVPLSSNNPPMNSAGTAPAPNFESITGQKTYQPFPSIGTQYTPTGTIPGLISPHAPVGGVSSAPVASHSVTTDGQGSTTSKVTYVQPDTSQQSNPTTSIPSFSDYAGTQEAGAQGLYGSGLTQEQQAFQNAQALQAKLAGSQTNEANELANMQGNPIPIEFQQGRGNIVQQAFQTQQAALSSQEQAQATLAGTGANLASAGQAGLGAATTAVSPHLGTVGTQTYYNPVTSQTTTGGTNTPATGGIAQGEAALGSTLPAMSAGIQAAQQVQGDINTLISTKNLNPYAANALNSINQWAQGQQLSNPAYNELVGDLNDYAGKIAPIIGAMGVQTDAKTFIAQQMLNGSAQGQTITQVLDNLNTLLGQSYSSAQKAAYGGQPAESNGTANSNVTSSVFPGTSYSLVNGVWTATQT